jgi:hypothetical protein
MLNHDIILNHIDDIFGQDMHAKRVLSLANATHGVIESGSLAIHAIGNGLSLASGLERKHAVKQIDRLLTNTKLNVWHLLTIGFPSLRDHRDRKRFLPLQTEDEISQLALVNFGR